MASEFMTTKLNHYGAAQSGVAAAINVSSFALAVFVFCLTALVAVALSVHAPAVMMLFCFIGFAVLNYLLGGRDVLYPAFIFSACWTVAIAVYLVCPIEIDDLTWPTVSIFIGGCASLTVGSILGNRPLFPGETWFTETARNRLGARALLLCSFALLIPFTAIRTRVAGESLFSPTFLISRKVGAGDANIPYYAALVLVVAPLFSVLTLWILIMERESKLLIGLAGIIAFFMCISGGQRGGLFRLLCGAIIIRFIRFPARNFRAVGKYIAMAGFGVSLLMVLLSLLVKTEAQQSDGLQIALQMGAIYIAGPLAGFNYQVTHPAAFRDQPWNTFTQILSPLVKNGLIHMNLPVVNEEFVRIPFLFNVFTIYKQYYHDFGPLGCMIFLLLFGLVYGSIYRATINGNRLTTFIFAIGSEELVMSIFHDSFNYQMTEYSFMLMFTLVYFLWISRMQPVKIRL
jgi:oligosaccharide repeat unit polymerase